MPKRLFLLCVLGNLLFASSQIFGSSANENSKLSENLDINSNTNLNSHSNLDENLSLNANLNATKIYNDDKKDFKNDLNALKNTLLNAKIYENPKWLALLHYENGKSRVQKGSNFFLAKNGHKNAKDEYVATIERFFDELERHKIQNLKDTKQGKKDEIQGTKQNAQTLN